MSWLECDEAGPCWINGLYKIRFYDRIPEFRNGRPGYIAYYIRKGDRNWGYHVNQREPYYGTLDEAQKACDAHWETVKDERWAQQLVEYRANVSAS